jgi:hypothetical protein
MILRVGLESKQTGKRLPAVPDASGLLALASLGWGQVPKLHRVLVYRPGPFLERSSMGKTTGTRLGVLIWLWQTRLFLRLAPEGLQCRKCLTPVNTMASPRRFAVSTTSVSRIEPPG